MKKQLAKSVVLMLLGLALIIWGSVIYNHYPQIKEMKQIMWEATKAAKYQYITGFILLIASYVVISTKK